MLVAFVSIKVIAELPSKKKVIAEHTVLTTITTSLQRPYISTSHIINHAQTVLSKETLKQNGFSRRKRAHVSLDLKLISIYKLNQLNHF